MANASSCRSSVHASRRLYCDDFIRQVMVPKFTFSVWKRGFLDQRTVRRPGLLDLRPSDVELSTAKNRRVNGTWVCGGQRNKKPSLSSRSQSILLYCVQFGSFGRLKRRRIDGIRDRHGVARMRIDVILRPKAQPSLESAPHRSRMMAYCIWSHEAIFKEHEVAHRYRM